MKRSEADTYISYPPTGRSSISRPQTPQFPQRNATQRHDSTQFVAHSATKKKNYPSRGRAGWTEKGERRDHGASRRTLASAGSKTTWARFWSSDTAARRTPRRAESAASTAPVHAEHVMPVTRTCTRRMPASARSPSASGPTPASSS
jgi:hypothetical protein